jgi:hypothetical protein
MVAEIFVEPELVGPGTSSAESARILQNPRLLPGQRDCHGRERLELTYFFSWVYISPIGIGTLFCISSGRN